LLIERPAVLYCSISEHIDDFIYSMARDLLKIHNKFKDRGPLEKLPTAWEAKLWT